jgi:hypothetical protein
VEEIAIEEDEPVVDLSDELEGLSDDEDSELFDGEQVGVYTISAEPDEPAVEAFDLLPAILEPAAVLDLIPDAAVTIPMLAEPASVTELPIAEPAALEHAPAEAVFVEPPEPPRADIEPWVPMYLTPGRLWPALEGMPAEMPAPRSEQPDWIELVASLRQDLERRGSRPSEGATANTAPPIKKPKVHVKKAKPVQDEWGFFDPEQCGFSTLLAKLEEITEDGRT